MFIDMFVSTYSTVSPGNPASMDVEISSILLSSKDL